MRKGALFLLVILLQFPLLAQRIQANWGDPVPIARKSYLKKIVGVSQGSLFALRSEQAGFMGPYVLFLEKYSLDGLKLQSTTPLVMPIENGEETKFNKLLATESNLFLFTTQYAKAKKEKIAYGYTINSEGKPKNVKQLDKIEKALSYKDGSFDFVLTEDSTHILAYHNKPFAKNNNEKFAYTLLDLNLNQVWERSIEIPYPDKEVTIKKYFGDKNNNIFMLAKVEEPALKDEADYKYMVLAYYAKKNELKEFEISLPSRAISQIQVSLLPNGNLAAAGFYSNSVRQDDQMGGVFSVRIDNESKEIAASGYQDFDVEFLKLFLTERQAEKGRELESFQANHLELLPDGSLLLAGEQYYTKQICITDPRTGMLECTDHYYYNDIVAIKIEDDGEIAWSKRIPKRQYSTSQQNPFFSYLFGMGSETIHFVFLDNPKNIEIGGDEYAKATTNPTRAALVNVTVRDDGTTYKNVLFNVRDKQTTLMPSESLLIGRGHYFVYGEGRKSCKIGEMVFE